MKRLFLILAVLIGMSNAMVTANIQLSIQDRQLVAIENGVERVISPNGTNMSYIWPSVSPDGQHIAYYVSGIGCYVANPDGSNPRFIAHNLRDAKWLSNDELIGMNDQDDGHVVTSSCIVVYHLNGLMRQLTPDTEFAMHPKIDAANGRITYTDENDAVKSFAYQFRLPVEAYQQAETKVIKKARKVNTTPGIAGKRIYINAGHGSWGPNDRPMATISHPNLSSTGMPDHDGFYESNTNLWKALELGRKLEAAGAVVVQSRTENGPWPYAEVNGEYPSYSWTDYQNLSNYTQYNRAASDICEEVELGNFDYFLAIHSNTLSDGSTKNYPILLYGGQDDETYMRGDSKQRAQVMWPYLFECMDSGLDPKSAYSLTSPNVRGDVSFYSSGSWTTRSNGNRYYGYIGVLRHGCPGFWSEGYFHTYQPARHRALNPDYCKQEGIRYFRGIMAYYGENGENVGYIMGTVKDLHEQIVNDLFHYAPETNDQWLPLNGAVVKLYKAGVEIASYTVDNNYNGIFYFPDLVPGNDYTLEATMEGYKPLFDEYKQPITVEANKTTYPMIYLESRAYNNPSTPSTAQPNIYAFGLKGTMNGDVLNIEYSLNADATSAKVQIKNNAGNVVKTVALSGLTKGSHTAAINLATLTDANYTWEILAQATPITELTLVNDPDDEQYSFYYPMGIDVDYFPTSPNFGKFYVSNSCDGASDGHNTTAQSRTKGIYVYDAFSQCSQPNSLVGYQGNVAWTNGSNIHSPRRVKVGEDGLLYLCDYGETNGGIYIMNPANPTADFVPLFAANKRGQTYARPSALDVVGVGAARRVYTFDYNTNTSLFSCYRYDIGAENNSTVIPVDIFPSSIMNGYNNIRYDGRGGFWFAQSRYQVDAYPALGHVNATGELDFTKTDLSNSNGNVSYRGQLCLNKDKTLLAFTGNKVVTVFAISWGSDGIPNLTQLYQTPVIGNNIDGVAFDYADNLYVVSASTERLYIYATPKSDNSTTVPAATPIRKGIVFDGGLLNLETMTIGGSWFGTSAWESETQSSATYENGVLTVNIAVDKSQQWQAQVKLLHNVNYSANEIYTFTCKFHSNKNLNGVTLHLDDNLNDPSFIFESQTINLTAGVDYVYTSAPAVGVEGNNHLMIFDFAPATAGTVITVSDMRLTSVPAPSIHTIAELYTMEDDTQTRTQGTVSMVVGNCFWIQDATGGIGGYQQDHGLIAGQKVKLSANKVTYAGLPELRNITIESRTWADSFIQPENVTLTHLINNTDAYISKLVHVDGLVITEYDPYHNPTLTDNTNTIPCYQITLDREAFPIGTKVNITAILDSYNGSLQFRGNPENVEFVSLPEQPDPDPDPNPERDTYNLTLSVNNPQVGIVTGAGTYAKNARIYIDAFPINSAYKFSHWSDGKTESSRYITMTRDYNLTAYFEVSDGLENTLMNTEQPVRIYTITGQEVTDHSGSLPRGIYIIQTGDKVQKIFVP